MDAWKRPGSALPSLLPTGLPVVGGHGCVCVWAASNLLETSEWWGVVVICVYVVVVVVVGRGGGVSSQVKWVCLRVFWGLGCIPMARDRDYIHHLTHLCTGCSQTRLQTGRSLHWQTGK